MKIIVDAMGGDHAPQAIVQGALDACKAYGVQILLVGRTAEILKAVEACGEKTLPAGVEIRDASEVVEICDDPAIAFKLKKDSSMTVGLQLLKDGVGDAFVSAGSTGALLSGATLLVKRIRGIRRAAMCPQIPTAEGRALLCDCGANAECTPEYLLQFAYLGNYYAQRVLGLASPRVALLNIGAEESKGDALRRETYALLQAAGEAGRIRFVGNIEGSDAMLGGADVIVADGFSGNVMLKTMEGTAKFISHSLQDMLLSTAKTKLAAALIHQDLRAFKRMLDPSEIGGTPFLGITRPVIKAHGSSNALAIRNAVRQAKEFAESGFIADVETNVEFMRVKETGEKV
ncbi:MAG: phosphate acyltransferase PlsX [Oscillibacter sp.]